MKITNRLAPAFKAFLCAQVEEARDVLHHAEQERDQAEQHVSDAEQRLSEAEQRLRAFERGDDSDD